jgi:hypothetical protein
VSLLNHGYGPRHDPDGAHVHHWELQLQFKHASYAYYALIAKRCGGIGSQCFSLYGRHTNQYLLQHYGFALENNPDDLAEISLPLQVTLVKPFD